MKEVITAENLIQGKDYLVETKRFGKQVAKFKEIGKVNSLEQLYAKFEVLKLIWVVPVEEINKKVSEVPF